MTKSDLIAAISTNAGLTKAEADRALNAMLGSMSNALANGDKITLVGFGTYTVGTRAARTGRNPQTGATIQIPASKNIRFKASKTLKYTL